MNEDLRRRRYRRHRRRMAALDRVLLAVEAIGGVETEPLEVDADAVCELGDLPGETMMVAAAVVPWRDAYLAAGCLHPDARGLPPAELLERLFGELTALAPDVHVVHLAAPHASLVVLCRSLEE